MIALRGGQLYNQLYGDESLQEQDKGILAREEGGGAKRSLAASTGDVPVEARDHLRKRG